MADLKSGTTVAGAGIWHASNLPIVNAGNTFLYRNFKVYTENDKPTPEEVGALSSSKGGTVAGDVSLTKNLTVGSQVTAAQQLSTQRASVIRGDGVDAPAFALIRGDVKDTSAPAADVILGYLPVKNGSNTSDQFAGKTLTQITTIWATSGGGRLHLDARKNNIVSSRLTIDAGTSTATIDIGDFQVAGNTRLQALSAVSVAVSGALNAQTVTPNDWTNHDSRYMSGIPKAVTGGVTTFASAAITEKSDLYSISSAFTDGPLSTASTTYAGILVNYRRALNSGVSIVQTLFIDKRQYVRTASGSPGAFVWTGSGTNGWRLVYDTENKPAPGDFNAVSKSGDTMTGALNATSLAAPVLRINQNGAEMNFSMNSGGQRVDVNSSGVARVNWNAMGQQNVGAIHVGSTANNVVSTQGIHLLWNESGDGRGSIIVNRGGGTGGLNIRFVNAENTVETGSIRMDGGGSLVATNDIIAGSRLMCGNGNSFVATDGNVYGSVWGGYLSTWVANNFYGRAAGDGVSNTANDAWNKANIAQNNCAQWVRTGAQVNVGDLGSAGGQRSVPAGYTLVGLNGTGGQQNNSINLIAGRFQIYRENGGWVDSAY